MLLQDRVCVVAGVGPGLGRTLSLLLAEHGAHVVLAARRQQVLRSVAQEVEALGRRALVVPTDLTDPDHCRRLVARTVEEMGALDVLVANAYKEDVFEPFATVDLATWRGLMDVNLWGPLQLAQAAVPAMRQDGGAMVFVSSMIVRKPRANQSGYAVAKGALAVAARSLAQELGRHRIRVNSVLPGWIWGPGVQTYLQLAAAQRGATEDEVLQGITRRIPLGTVPSERDVAGAVVYLASDLAASVTGQAIDVNGGEVMA